MLSFFGGLLTVQKNWLNKMAEKGYRLIRTGKLLYEFEKCSQEAVVALGAVYRTVFFSSFLPPVFTSTYGPQSGISGPLHHLAAQLCSQFAGFLLPFIGFFVQLVRFGVNALQPKSERLIDGKIKLSAGGFRGRIVLISRRKGELPGKAADALRGLLAAPDLIRMGTVQRRPSSPSNAA